MGVALAGAVAGAWPVTPAGSVLGENLSALESNQPAERAAGARELSKMGPAALPALAALRKALGDADPEVRYWAACALGHVGPEAAAAVPDLIAMLTLPERNLRSAAAYALGEIGPAAAAAVPQLAQALRHPDEVTRSNAATALTKMGDAVMPVLLDALRTGDLQTRLDVTSALRGKYGCGAVPGIPDVMPQCLSEIMALAFPAGAGEGVSRLANGSFEEDGLAGWKLLLEGGAVGEAVADGTAARTGRRSLRLTRRNAAGRLCLRSAAPVEIAPGETAVFRGYFRAEDAPTSAALLFRFEDEKGALQLGESYRGHAAQSQSLLRNAPAGFWDKRVAEFRNTGKTPVRLYARVYLVGNPATVWLDDLTFPSVPWRLCHSSPVMTLPRLSTAEAEERLARRPDATGTVAREGGRAVLRVNGKPAAPVLYHSLRPEFAEFAGMESLGGVSLHTVMISINDLVDDRYPAGYPVWTRTDRCDFTSPLQALRKLAATAPDSYAVLHFNVAWPADWVDRHPEEAWVNAAGERAYGTSMHFMGFARELPHPSYRWWPSPCSEVALEDAARVMRAFLAEVKKTPYRKMVVGCMISGGHDGQFFTANWPDHSASGKRAFGRWLRGRYGTVEALRRAWRRPDAGFDGVEIPAGARPPGRDPLAVSFRDPRTETAQADYGRFLAEQGLVIRDRFARVFKEGIGKPAFALTWQMGGGKGDGVQSIFLKPSSALDGIAPQPAYELRQPGHIGGLRATLDAFGLHGKLAIKELDLRTWLRTGGTEIETQRLGATLSPEWFRTVNRKEVGQMIAAGQGYWYFDIGTTHFRDAALLGEIRKTRALAETLAGRRDTFRPDVVVVTVEDSEYWCPPFPGGGSTPLALQRYAPMDLKTSGVPYDEHYLDDILARPELQQYKVYLFPDAFRLTDEQRRLIAAKLQRGGRTLVWQYAPGFVADEGLSLPALSQMVGMGVRTEPGIARTMALAVPAGLAAGLSPLPGMGEAYRAMHTLNEGPVPYLDVQRFWIDDPAAEVLARYADGKAAIGVRRIADWTSVYSAAPAGLDAGFLHNLARGAGAYVAAPVGPALEMNGNLISLHGVKGGRFPVTLPRRCTVRDAFSGQVLGKDATQFTADVPAQQTRWYLLA